MAVQSGNLEVVQTLCEAAKAAGKDVGFFVAENDEYEHTVTLNNVTKAIVGQTALHLACAMRNQPMIKMLVSLGATPIAKDKNNETCLMRCIELGLEDEFNLLLKLCPTVRLEVSDKLGRTPLHWALKHNRPAMAKTLIEKGHDCFMEDQDKQIPMMLAAYGAFAHLLEPMLNNVDPFLIQNQWGNGPVNIDGHWLPFVMDEVAKSETTKLLQKKLEVILKQQAQNAAQNPKGAKPGAKK